MERRKLLQFAALIPFIGIAKKALAQDKKQIYLTIDDGPSRYNPLILENLKNNKAIFYMLGSLMNTNEGFYNACKTLEKGNIIGNHSYSHPVFPRISYDRAVREIERTDELIEKIYKKVGMKRLRKFFRFPYGSVKGSAESYLEDKGFEIQHWDTDTLDWRYYSRNQLSLERILRNCARADNEDIVLIHERNMTAKRVIPFFVEEYILKIPDNAQKFKIDPTVNLRLQMGVITKEK